MKLLVIQLDNIKYYSHRLSGEGGIWFKEFRKSNYIKVPVEIEQAKKGDGIELNGVAGSILSDSIEEFVELVKRDHGQSIERFRDKAVEVSKKPSIAGIAYKIATTPIYSLFAPVNIPSLKNCA